jgi:hypothetical protein
MVVAAQMPPCGDSRFVAPARMPVSLRGGPFVDLKKGKIHRRKPRFDRIESGLHQRRHPAMGIRYSGACRKGIALN